MFHPASILITWLFGLVSLAIPVAGALLVHEWYQQSNRLAPLPRDPFPSRQASDASLSSANAAPLAYKRVFSPEFGWNVPTALLAGGVCCCLLSAGGGLLLMRLTLPRARKSMNETRPFSTGRLRRADGTVLAYETSGRPDGPILVLTHGLAMDRAVWQRTVAQFASRYRLVTWDLTGMGQSTRGHDQFSMTNLADDLAAIVRTASEEAGGGQVISIGHSLGGMLNLEMHREPENRELVRGIVQVHTTYTNPLRTMKGARLYTALEAPVIKPLLYASIALSPLVRLMNLLSYLNGSAHLATWKDSFAARPTFEELDFAARYAVFNSPANLGRVNLALLDWDASDLLERVDSPALVVSADRDGICVPEASETMRHRIAQAELCALTPAKHLGLLQRHVDFGRCLGDFCERVHAKMDVVHAATHS